MAEVRRTTDDIGNPVIEYDGSSIFDRGQSDEEAVRRIETIRREKHEWLSRWRQRVETDFGGDAAAAEAAARRGLGARMDEEARTSNAIWRDQREDAVRRALDSIDQ